MERRPGFLRYEREELLRLQGEFGQSQGEWWAQHLKDLGPDVEEELHELQQQAVPETSQLRRRSKNSERRQRVKAKREALHALSINALGSDKDEHEECDNFLEDPLDASSNKSFEKSSGLRHVGRLKGKGSRNYDSFYTEDIPEPESFQPQAFAVEGEPNFESGPPEDGWEYLRRVKYEAARCPKVVVAQIDPTKLISEQTPYMPEIPDIPVCPSDLLPSKEWEEYFLGDFSLLRMALSNIRVPPTFPAERIPSLRNKAAWEVRCFGCNTSVEEEESNELDSVTNKEPVAEPEDEESATPAETPSLPSIDSAKDESDCAANESRSELLAGDKELLEPIIEFVETQIDPLLDTGSVESSYVIDFGLITDYVPNYEPEEPFNESVYFISGEPTEADDEVFVPEAAAAVPEPEDDPAQSAKPIESPSSNLMEAGPVEHSTYGIVTRIEQLNIGGPEEQHVEDECTNSPSSHPIPHIKRDEPINAGVEGLIRVHPHTAVHAEVEPFTEIGTQASENLQSAREDAEESGIQSTQPSGNFEVFEGGLLETADSMIALDGDAWARYETEFVEFGGIDSQFESLTVGDPEVLQSGVEVQIPSFSDPELLEVQDVALDEAEFRDLYSGLDSQFDSLAIGDPEVVEGGVEIEIPSFSDAELLEVEDVDLPTDDFVDALIGLEVFSRGNILESDPEEDVDPFDDGTEFKIDGPLEELLTKVFQQVGVAQLPFIHLLLRLDEVSRAALLRHHVSWLENVNGLPKDRALWLLALSAVVDTPLDSQTSAAFRALLRHCSAVRALKQSRDDEDLYLLNVLIAVAGVYFGQAEANLL